MVLEEKINNIRNSNEEISKAFKLKLYSLKEEKYVFIEFRNDENEFDELFLILDNLFREFERNQIFNIIFSFRRITFIDLSISIIFSHAQIIESKNGTLIFCDVDAKLFQVFERLELDKFSKIYSSESEMLK